MRKLKSELKLKSGESFPKGTPCDVTFNGKDRVAFLKLPGREALARIGCAALCTYVTGFRRPSEAELESYVSDAICPTVSGAEDSRASSDE